MIGDIAVRRGQVYRVPRRGKPARHVKVAGVQRTEPRQPKASYYLVTRSGRRVEPKGAMLYQRWLEWRDGAWRFPSSWEGA